MKCSYSKRCRRYQAEAVTCNEDGGVYHSDGHPLSCVREAAEADAISHIEAIVWTLWVASILITLAAFTYLLLVLRG